MKILIFQIQTGSSLDWVDHPWKQRKSQRWKSDYSHFPEGAEFSLFLNQVLYLISSVNPSVLRLGINHTSFCIPMTSFLLSSYNTKMVHLFISSLQTLHWVGLYLFCTQSQSYSSTSSSWLILGVKEHC